MNKNKTTPFIGGRTAHDAAVSSGYTFLVGELEKVDPKLREPLTSTNWPRDIVCKTGGGWVEDVSSLNIDYATVGDINNSIVANMTNDLPIMQVDISKDRLKVYTFANGTRISYIDQEKFKKITRNLEDMLNKGIRLNHDKLLDMNVYTGIEKYGTTGLINNPNVTIVSAEDNGSGSTKFKDKTPDQILNDINMVMVDTWGASEHDLTGMANHILLPPEQYADIVSRKVSNDASKSILTYLLENNIGKNQGVDLFIGPLPMLKGAGTAGTDRMIGYVNDEDRVRFHQTVPLNRAMTGISAENMCYVSTYVSQFSEVEFLYYQPVQYVDGI